MATYLESVQWAVRPCTATPERPPLGEVLPLNLGPVTHGDVAKVVKGMKRGRACGEDGIPAEFWLAVLAEGSSGAHWLVDFCQKCWEDSSIPHDWHV